ncbi:MAG: hypothetical protein U5K54_14130 [Cytophagales bacterium]|nr:hypothetical protein [Cytophagales bacterium]
MPIELINTHSLFEYEILADRSCCYPQGCAEKQTSNLFSYGKEVGTVSKKLEEASGLVASRT